MQNVVCVCDGLLTAINLATEHHAVEILLLDLIGSHSDGLLF